MLGEYFPRGGDGHIEINVQARGESRRFMAVLPKECTGRAYELALTALEREARAWMRDRLRRTPVKAAAPDTLF